MRILAIRGANIASLTEFDIDFAAEPLRSAGIFAIVGPTGAGKSSLLDAMCLALYQKAPRLDDLTGRETPVESRFGAIPQSDIRNLLRRGCDTGFAECDFRAGDGKAYRSRWGYRAPKKKGAQVQEEMTLVCLDDQRVLVAASGKKTEFQASIERLVGLKYPEFMRTVLLAQGRFAEFLRSDENQRADLLEKLTGTGIYARISRKIFERTKAAKARVEQVGRDLGNLTFLDEAELEAKTTQAAVWEDELPRLEERAARVRTFREGLERRETTRVRGEVLRKELAEARERAAEHEGRLGILKQNLSDAEAARTGAQEEIAKARGLDARLLAAVRLLEQAEFAMAGSRGNLEELQARNRETRVRYDDLETRLAANRTWLDQRRAKLEALASRWPLWQERLQRADRLRIDADAAAKRVADGEKLLSELETERDARRQELSQRGADEALDVAAVHADLSRLAARRTALQTAVPWMELRAEIAAAERRITTAREQLAAREARLPGLDATWNLSHRLLQDTRTALSGDVVHLRTALVEGEACPVCGAVEHPWAAKMPAFDALLSRHEQEEARSRADLQEARSERDAAKGALGALEAADRTARARLESLTVAPGILAEFGEAPESSDRLRASLTEVERRERETMTLLEALQERDRLRARLAELEARIASLRESHEREAARAAQVGLELEECLASLDAPIAVDGWRVKWRENPGFATQVTESVEAYLAKTRSLDELDREREPLVATLETQEEAIRAKTAEWNASVVATQAARAECDGLRSERDELLDGRPVAEVEAALEAAATEARTFAEAGRNDHAAAQAAVASLEGAIRQIEGQEREENARNQELERELFGEVPEETESVDSSAKARELARSLDDRRAEVGRLLAELSLELARDRENRGKGERLAREKRELEADELQWSLLNDHVGSSDGLRFKKIAQQFTLEVLLDEANAQLHTIAPRYTLQMLGSSLHFGVVDHESYDELRPVHTLSGGEGFLVSLGLALGLSRMAGGDLSVESLFIDEGFGTLDGETLQGVMAALSQLHAQGRKVGLITHVEEMKEQIPVRIEVVRMGQGTSRVEVRG